MRDVGPAAVVGGPGDGGRSFEMSSGAFWACRCGGGWLRLRVPVCGQVEVEVWGCGEGDEEVA